MDEYPNGPCKSNNETLDLPEKLTKDTITYYYDKELRSDNELPPDLTRELQCRPGWLASRTFPLEAGDALIRDVRLWHGGCPNLSREARYLPSFEVASTAIVEHFSWHAKPWPFRGLPAF